MSSNLFAYEDPTQRASEALLDAAAIGRVQALQQAIADGGNPNHMRMDISPCLAAVSGDHVECVRLVIQAGGGADQPNRMGWTALHEAAVKEDTTILDIILASEYEQSLTCRDRQGWTALRAAVDAGRPESVAKLLAEEPGLLNMVDRDGVSPLMAAAQARNSFMMEVLLSSGADLDVSDLDGRNISDYVEDWPEGQSLLDNHAHLLPTKEAQAPATKVAVQETVEQDPDPTPAANPFGLGGMKKMRKGP